MERHPGTDFDAAARHWDEEPRRLALAANVTDAMRRAVPLSPRSRVLDLGCGTGLVTLALAPDVGTITGADGSAEMLAVLEGKARARRAGNVSTVKVDLDSDAPLGGPFDVVVSSMVLHHVRDTGALLARVLESLRPGGAVALADLEPEGGAFHDDNAGVHHFGFDPAEIAGRLAEGGFVEVTVSRAATMIKEKADGPREFRVFLAVARRPV